MRLLPALAMLAACSDYGLNGKNHHADTDSTGDTDNVADGCDYGIGGFEPVVEWDGPSGHSNGQVIVADLDGDGKPELLANVYTGMFNPLGATGELVVMHGDGTEAWRTTDAKIGYGSTFAVADLDGDGKPEIVTVRQYRNTLAQGGGDYTAIAFDNTGNLLWESPHYDEMDFDYATAPVIADMEGDGDPEVIVGRVILHADGTQRGRGEYGRGSYGTTQLGQMTITESTVPAVVDLNGDGVMEVIVGNAQYDPDGNAIMHDIHPDGMIAVANLDDDPEGEYVSITGNTVRLVDTSGVTLWGPTTIPGANILAPAGLQDLDGDGIPEIVTAGGNELWTMHADGTMYWQAAITDESGATGASFFDFEGDGEVEVVYEDEVAAYAFNGKTGEVKFKTTHHSSRTMFDYPTVADIDDDGHAELVVANDGIGTAAFSVFGDANNSWARARKVLNQHAYSITNIDDDLSVPTDTTANFDTFNSWHSALDRNPTEDCQ